MGTNNFINLPMILTNIIKTKFILITLILALFIPSIRGQDAETLKKLNAKLVADTIQGWKKGGIIGVNLAQTSLTNWAAGGQNSVAVNGLFSLFANLSRDKSRWDNSLDIGYGILKQEGLGTRKTDDRLEFLSKYGRQAFGNFYYAALLNFKTQFTDGYNYAGETRTRISDFMSPGYLVLALGLDFKPNAYISAFIAPVTAKYTFVNDDSLSAAGAFGVTPGENLKSELGGYMRAVYSKNDYQSEFLKNVTFISKLDLFSNYGNNPQNIDVSWENIISLKVNKFISANITTHLVYDDDIMVPFDRNDDGTAAPGELVGSKIQFKEILGIGFSYNFK